MDFIEPLSLSMYRLALYRRASVFLYIPDFKDELLLLMIIDLNNFYSNTFYQFVAYPVVSNEEYTCCYGVHSLFSLYLLDVLYNVI